MSITSPTMSPLVPDNAILYQTRLKAGEIRLLKFRRAWFRDKTPTDMEFATETYSLDQAPAFAAISYTWSRPYSKLDSSNDDQTEPPYFEHGITINDIPILVTMNMWDALVAAMSYGSTAYIWMDACCINQSDLSERSAQVLLMGSIYSAATTVICYLGHLHPDLDSFHWLLLDLMPRLAQMMLENKTPVNEQSLWSIRDLVTNDKRHFEASLVGAHRFYYSCRWFRRAWVRQEMVLARKPRLICGRTELPWDGLALAEELFLASRWSRELFEYKYVYLHPFLAEDRFGGIIRAWRGFRRYRDDPAWASSFEETCFRPIWNADNGSKLECAWLLEYVLSIRDAQCSDPRDKVFAVLGLAPGCFANIVQLLQPSYTQSIATVYSRVFRVLVENLKSLNFLAAVEPISQRSIKTLPSWVPDLSINFPYNIYRQNALGYRFQPEIQATLSQHLQISCDGDLLCIQAAPIDIIEAVQSQASLKRHETLENLISLLELCKPCPKLPGGQGRFEQLWRTCVKDCHSERGKLPWRPALETLGFCFHAYILISFVEAMFSDNSADVTVACDLIKSTEHDFAPEVASKEFPSLEETMACLTWIAEAGEEWMYDIREPTNSTGNASLDELIRLKALVATWERALEHAQTTQNRCGRSLSGLLCSASPDLQIGDEIWFAASASLPLILRPSGMGCDRVYSFVSMAYVHGIMDGELFVTNKTHLTKMHTIRIR